MKYWAGLSTNRGPIARAFPDRVPGGGAGLTHSLGWGSSSFWRGLIQLPNQRLLPTTIIRTPKINSKTESESTWKSNNLKETKLLTDFSPKRSFGTNKRHFFEAVFIAFWGSGG